MEDDGSLSFDFEGGLDAVPVPSHPSSAAPGVLLPSESGGPGHPPPGPGSFPPGLASGGGANMPGRRSFRQTVCRHWLRSLCMKGDMCGFLHQYDKNRMPICRFFRQFGECREQDCVYKHTNEDIKECNMYKMGFCPNGPDCRYRHAKLPGPPPPVEEVLQKIQQLSSFNYGPSNRFQHRSFNYTQQADKPQVLQDSGVVHQATAAKPLVALESPNIQQPQSQNQQSQQQQQQQQQQQSNNQAQNIPNGFSNQVNRIASPLPQGQSRCVWSF